MSQDLKAGDFLVFQLEAGYGLLRVLAIDERAPSRVWHLSTYNDLFLDVESAEAALSRELSVSHRHLVLTDRAFESTQVARIANRPLTRNEAEELAAWRSDADHEVSDRSVRLMLGLR